MVHDPTDEKHRKPRRLRNTVLQKYVRITSVSVTLAYILAMYISFRRNVLPHINDERYKLNEEDSGMAFDYATNPIFRGAIDKLIKRQETKAKAEDESKNT